MHLPVLATYLQALLIDPIPICILSILPYTGMTSKKSIGEYLMILTPTLTVHRVIFLPWMLFAWSIIWHLSFLATYLPVMLNPIPICILSTLYYRAEGFVVTPQKQKKHSAKTIHAVVTPPKQSNEDGSKAKFKYQPSEFCSTRSCSCVVSLHLSLSKTNTNINTIPISICKIVHCTILPSAWNIFTAHHTFCDELVTECTRS